MGRLKIILVVLVAFAVAGTIAAFVMSSVGGGHAPDQPGHVVKAPSSA
jgi:hypothetical protein